MRNIENIKKRYIKLFAHKYYNKLESQLTDQEKDNCFSLAELWAYIYVVVPEEHSKYTIFDFDGYISNKSNDRQNVISHPIALSAKDKICKYCWGIGWEEIKKQKAIDGGNIISFLRKRSIMMNRLKKGDNIVIFGTSEEPIGRTMLASIVMKEAIKLRVTHRDRKQTYDWIDFTKLFEAIFKDSNDLSDYRSCDWLVVDNIMSKFRSAKQTTLMIDLIDTFFIDRFNYRLPTILVFKFDIRDKSMMMEKRFGVGINRIIRSKRTYRIPLSKKLSTKHHE